MQNSTSTMTREYFNMMFDKIYYEGRFNFTQNEQILRHNLGSEQFYKMMKHGFVERQLRIQAIRNYPRQKSRL
jgi:hypothetical protein